LPAWPVTAQEKEPEEPKLLGRITAQDLGQKPYGEWFTEPYIDYTPNREILADLKAAVPEDLEITAFFGTWCGDSRREIPRFLKLLDKMEFPGERLSIVALDREEDAVKRSPGGEEKGLEVYKVPTLVLSRGGAEIGRMVEHPVLSLERDLLTILSGQPYQPSYKTYPIIRRWRREGLLTDKNISPSGLADQIRHEIASESELAAMADVLFSRGEVTEAVMLYRTNCVLYPTSARGFARLAEGLRQAGEQEEARKMAEEALRLNTDPAQVEDLVALLTKIRG
jgi:thiol-disulfide isomerase/thioredoxin